MMKEYNEARIDELEASKVQFRKIVTELEAWLEVNALDRSIEDRPVFKAAYQTADMKTEILAILDREIEGIREDIPADYTSLGIG